MIDPNADTVVMTAITAPTPVPSWPALSPSAPQVLAYPIPRRRWRVVICLMALGHFWFPGSDRCLDCGTRWRRWAG